MNINPSSNANINFKGYLRFPTGQCVNSKQVTSILYDRIDLVNHPKYHSASFMMSDGFRYLLNYIEKPTKSLLASIMEANQSDLNTVYVPATLVLQKVPDNIQSTMQSMNKETLTSLKE